MTREKPNLRMGSAISVYVDYEITVTDPTGNTVLQDRSPKAAIKAIESMQQAPKTPQANIQ